MSAAACMGMCSLPTERVLLLQNVFSYYRTCSLTTERVLLLQNVFSYYRMCSLRYLADDFSVHGYDASVHAQQNVFSYYRMCSLTTECVLLGT